MNNKSEDCYIKVFEQLNNIISYIYPLDEIIFETITTDKEIAIINNLDIFDKYKSHI